MTSTARYGLSTNGHTAVSCRAPTSIDRPHGAEVLAHVFIKFRAGEATNKLGLNEAHSPYHVPWVWCETMMVKHRSELKLFGKGSTFPGHAWYVNGKQIATVLQRPVSAKPDDPALSTGRPASQPSLNHTLDRSEGAIQRHAHTAMPGKLVDVLVSADI
ncbi:MAG: hypothetical protein KTR32_24300 [Granulosicoccus sp.]|nr:hypothetical protein [Granulosicoccus sp.]